jgi:hypothetical protein
MARLVGMSALKDLLKYLVKYLAVRLDVEEIGRKSP